ncbi:MAG: tyrosine-type recombinase/integrase, partial [Nitrososphaeraceae archaeon]
VRSMRDNPIKKYARSTVNGDVAAILYFFDNNDIELNRKKIARYYPSDESTHDDRPYAVEEIRRILSVCDLRSKVMILLLASSGMRIGALPSLQIGDLTKTTFKEKDKNLDLNVYKIQVYARSKSERYYTFCTPECYKAIRDYLDYRKRCGEKIEIDTGTGSDIETESGLYKKDRSPLFRRQFNKGNPFEINAPRPMGKPAFTFILNEALKRSGVKTNEAMRSHAFRKGFKSICEHKGMKSLHVEMLMGHNVGLAGHYYRPTESDLLEDYMTHAADSLTIDPTFRLQKQVAKLESESTDEVARLRSELANVNEEMIEQGGYTRMALDALEEEISELKRQLNQVKEIKDSA